ncbi:tetratricopeptide repeat domain-containing protein [Penicillium malachiteum]|uniref:tetratricopeptide repeat domain-containing protein n=1 Tax=Penicillium malachiteum TaxID=1324776 RepID=UPI0025486397|nr:tetratricopeptide repeat domain-containing protein [Penicillium malachiteum]KAJ5715295.1 tetratricopeptide repeat domain-containing protein [Penicillium malachiteum]
MDPFSTAAAAVGLVEMCLHVAKSLKDLKYSVANIGKVIDQLIAEVEALQSLVASIQQIITSENATQVQSISIKTSNLEDLWRGCVGGLSACQALATQIESVIKEISGTDGNRVKNNLDAVLKVKRRRENADRLQKIRDEIGVEKSNLQVLLIGMTL